jgi:enoyl-CoA hydratase/carnithine racemase
VTFAPVEDDDVEFSYFSELRDMFTPLSRDRDLQAVVLTGSGERFSPPQPRRSMELLVASSLETKAGRLLSVQQAYAQLLTFRKPVVSAVNGQAQGIMAGFAFLSDGAVAVEHATFGDKHVPHGLSSGDGGTMYLPPLVGVSRAREILLLGSDLSAREALDLHLINRVVPAAGLLSAAGELARQLAALPRLPFLATKLALNNWVRLSGLVAWDVAAAYEAAGLAEPEFVARTTGREGH